jgi:hypothetical protein
MSWRNRICHCHSFDDGSVSWVRLEECASRMDTKKAQDRKDDGTMQSAKLLGVEWFRRKVIRRKV